ncbi:membrane protein [Citrobacter amalonaticus Y19]|uniref:Membrane protein n=1 Tax=Citrobacter amalonaticus Y19 TaxID=1261127 RepID=M1K4D5_CITAM|nr:membrane protein [Citrobacter amalonaticus Y19]
MVRSHFCHRWCSSIQIACISGLLLLGSDTLYARDFYFAPNSLEGGENAPQAADLAIFSNPKAQLPGSYPTQVLLNEHKVQSLTLSYINADDGSLAPLLTPAMLRQWGVKVDDYPELAKEPAGEQLKKNIGDYIPDASAHFDFKQQTLHLSMPQVAVSAVSAGYVDPSRWDAGIPVAFSDYSFSGQQDLASDQDKNQDRNQYLNLRSGINLGGWRLRNYGTWSNSSANQGWQTISNWLQHDIQTLKAQFVAGESSTRGEVFDSIQYSGVNIASDDEMLPGSERGYAPVIRGSANSNAVVTVKQNGYIIYQQNVAPGAFEISDLYASTNSSDLEITVKESDGSEHTTTQAFSSIALMQRPHRLRFEATVGRYRADSSSNDKQPEFMQGSAIYGLNNRLTAFGGIIAAENYNAIDSGLGVSLGSLGALSADVTFARTKLDNGETDAGQSWRVLYSSNIALTGTQFSLANYRYSSQGFYNFADANHRYTEEDDINYYDHKRNRIQLNVSQPLGSGGFYFNGYRQNYWQNARTEHSLSAGMNYSLMGINYNMSLTWSQTGTSPDDRTVYLGINIPLSRWLPGSWASYSLTNSQHGATSQNIGLNGSLLEDDSLSYSLQQSHSNQSPADSSSLYATWYAQYARLNTGYYSASDGSRQLSYGANGALVIHPHGVTLSQPLGDQFAVVNTDDTPGIHFQNQRGVSTDWFGNAVIPSLTAYQENRIGLDTTLMPDDVDSSTSALTVVPSRNAAVQAHFSARKGYRVLLTLIQPEGKPVPFGAMATSADGLMNGIVDDQGVVYLSGVNEATSLNVKWGNQRQQRCTATVPAPAESSNNAPSGIKSITAVCRQGE